MPQFRWPTVANDVSLAREVVGRRPSKPAEWDEIAAILNSAFSTPSKTVQLKGRGCRERLERLVSKYREDDSQSLKRSGTEEEYTELVQLLEDISTYQHDMEVALEKEKEEKKQKEASDRRKGVDMRKAAMETYSQRKRRLENDKDKENRYHREDDDFDEDFDGVFDGVSDKESPPKQKRASKLSAMELLEKKIDKKADLKKMELELKKKELELREIQMAREHEERQRREEEKQKRLDLEFAEKKVILELLQKLSSNTKSMT